MKKLILLVFALASFQITGQTNQNTAQADNGLGGALGGANSTSAPTNIPSATLPRTNEFGSPQSIQQRQEAIQEQQDSFNDTNPMGGSLGGSGTPTDTDINQPGLQSPSPSSVTPAPGVGTGATTDAPRGY